MKKHLLPALVLATLLSTFSSQAFGACSLQTPLDCVTNPGSIGESQRLGRYKVNIKNGCSKPIWVAVHFKNYDKDPNGSSCLGGGTHCVNKWITRGWWRLNPGQSKYIADTRNRIIYFSAHTQDRKETWGSDHTWSVRGVSEKFFKATMTNSFSDWTQRFTCRK